MKERGVIFSDAMVRAILDGRKTQTRLLLRLPHDLGPDDVRPATLDEWRASKADSRMADPPPNWALFRAPKRAGRMDGRGILSNGIFALVCPHGAVGARLWVREAWAVPGTVARSDDPIRAGVPIVYRADMFDPRALSNSWRSPIYMPRWASRITLEIVDVRAQRLQDITEEDARAEGLPLPGPVKTRLNVTYPDGRKESSVVDAYEFTALGAYCHLWDGMHGKRTPWSSNPWVWTITHRRI